MQVNGIPAGAIVKSPPAGEAADRDRVEFLYAEYERLTAPLTAGLGTKPPGADAG